MNYKLELKQIVEFPRCRIYRDFIQTLITTHNTDLKKRLAAFAAKHPQCCRQTDDDEEGGLTFEIEKGRLSFRLTAPYSEERRRAASYAAKQNGVHKRDVVP